MLGLGRGRERLVALPRRDQEGVAQPGDGGPPKRLLEEQSAHVRQGRVWNLAEGADRQATIEIASHPPGTGEDGLECSGQNVGARVGVAAGEQRHARYRPRVAGVKDDDPIGVFGRNAVKDALDQIGLRVDHGTGVAAANVIEHAPG